MRILPFLLAALAASTLSADVQKVAPAAAKDAPDAKAKDIVQLLAALGWPQGNSEAARKQITSASKDPKLAAYPAAYWKDYQDAAAPATFEKMLVPIFDKAYSAEEVKSLLKLLASPEMKQLLDKHSKGVHLLLDRSPSLLKGQAYEAFSAHMNEVGRKLREKHGIKAEPRK